MAEEGAWDAGHGRGSRWLASWALSVRKSRRHCPAGAWPVQRPGRAGGSEWKAGADTRTRS